MHYRNSAKFILHDNLKQKYNNPVLASQNPYAIIIALQGHLRDLQV